MIMLANSNSYFFFLPCIRFSLSKVRHPIGGTKIPTEFMRIALGGSPEPEISAD
jgi:hypothetical protein